jgi:hypothetical protein
MEDTGKKLKFRGKTFSIWSSEYTNGRRALSLKSGKGASALVITTNLPQDAVETDHVVVKNYSENEGILEACIEQGILAPPTRLIPGGFFDFPVCKVLI